MSITRLSDPHFTRNDLILLEEAQEITFDIFEILLNFSVFLIFFGNSPNIETPYWLRYSTFKVEDMRFTKEFRT